MRLRPYRDALDDGSDDRYDYSCDDCSWSGDNPKVLVGSSDDRFCPECGGTLDTDEE